MLRTLFSPFTCLSARIPDEIKSVGLNMVTILFIMNSILSPSLFSNNAWMKTVLIGTSLLFCIFFFILDRDSTTVVRVKIGYLIIIEFIGFCFLFNAAYYHVLGYCAIGLTFSVVIPLSYILIANYGTRKFFEVVAKATIFAYLIFAVLSYFLSPPLTRHYKSFLANSNFIGYLMSIVSASCLWLLYLKRERRVIWTIILQSILASAMVFCFFSASRTGMISVFLEEIIYVSIELLICGRNRGNAWGLFKRIIVFLLILIIVTHIIVVCFYAIKTGTGFNNIFALYSSCFEYFIKGVDESGIDMDSFASGRIGIWKEFAHNICLVGHAVEERPVISGKRVYVSTNAHNSYLQLAYTAGIPCGIAMTFLMALLTLEIIKELYKAIQRKSIIEEKLFAILCVAAFILPSLTSSGYMLYTYVPSTFFWISISAFAVAEKRN